MNPPADEPQLNLFPEFPEAFRAAVERAKERGELVSVNPLSIDMVDDEEEP